ncbi:hydrogenase nickel incorporation protein HypB [Jiella marina]|uniref:hydrogenase nickel incorporation protein HypB n=1 Tax=Jiella sp. LLJ827 TaxID=2917712 RepID=UPI00210088E1|nr:hydrogenase nickel incorporation protein HypB [Jiella sp. LLJ827]MCQ0988219.1 hydrogenase nickel incorporation protein HypB [Jiella sp. LLJ827]
MCTVCGCAGEGASIEGEHAHRHHHHHEHAHPHDHDHHHGHDHHGVSASKESLDYGQGPARAHAPGLSQARMIEIETNILSKNDRFAAENRKRLEASGVLALNLVSSPGSGKTTLLCETIRRLAGSVPATVIEGDQQTANDAERIRAAGAPAVQVNTGKGCHLDAHMVGHAMERLPLEDGGILFIENVGNLVCPAAFDLGEAAKVAILSVTEGEDKPLKYPDMFAASRLMILNKIDLAPHCDFDSVRCAENARRINPAIEVIELSAKTAEGFEAWLGWLDQRRRDVARHAIEALEARAAALRAAAGPAGQG